MLFAPFPGSSKGRKARIIFDVSEVFLGSFEKNKEKKDRVAPPQTRRFTCFISWENMQKVTHISLYWGMLGSTSGPKRASLATKTGRCLVLPFLAAFSSQSAAFCACCVLCQSP